MLREIKESDWKIFRELRLVALDRFCRRILDETAAIVTESDGGRSPHDCYLALFKLLEKRDGDLADAFNNPRRSSALLQLRLICAHNLLTPEELARFSEETQSIIEFLNK